MKTAVPAVARSLGSGTVTQSGTVIFNFTNTAPIFPTILVGPYYNTDKGVYLDVLIILPDENGKYKLDVTKDGTAVVLKWCWPESFKSMFHFDYEKGTSQMAANAHEELMGVQNPLYESIRHYPLGATVLPVEPEISQHKTYDGIFYIKSTLVVKKPPLASDSRKVDMVLPPVDANGNFLRKKHKNG
jgi:hypothetical protein